MCHSTIHLQIWLELRIFLEDSTYIFNVLFYQNNVILRQVDYFLFSGVQVNFHLALKWTGVRIIHLKFNVPGGLKISNFDWLCWDWGIAKLFVAVGSSRVLENFLLRGPDSLQSIWRNCGLKEEQNVGVAWIRTYIRGETASDWRQQVQSLFISYSWRIVYLLVDLLWKIPS